MIRQFKVFPTLPLVVVLPFCASFAFAPSSWSQTPDFRLRIQPIQVCSDDGTDCANTNQLLFSAETAKIWRQTGIDVQFLPWTKFYGSPWLNLTTSIFSSYTIYQLASIPGHGQNPDYSVLNMWFVKTISNGAFGHSIQTDPGIVERNGMAIADNTFSYNNGTGRLDTIAHEIGHNLGLDHDTLGASGPLNFMVPGRSVPSSISDIYPNGAALDQLTTQQVAQARSTSFLIPLNAELQIQSSNGCVTVSWQSAQFTLESAPGLQGPWTPFPGQVSPQIVPCTNHSTFFRLKH